MGAAPLLVLLHDLGETLESDLLHGEQLVELACKQPAKADPADRRTGGDRLPLEEKALRASGANAMVISTMMLSCLDNRARCRMIACLFDPVLSWFKRMNTTLRSVPASLQWLRSELTGKFVGTLYTVLRQLGSAGHLRRVGLACVAGYAKDAGDSDATRGQLVYEDELASLMATLASSIFAATLKRCAWMLLGPCAQSVLLLGHSRVRDTTLETLKGGHKRFFQIRATIRTNPGAKKLYDRHVCAMVPVQQIMLALHQKGWVCDVELAEWLQNNHCRVLGNQVVEDGFSRQKRGRKAGANRRGKVQHMMAYLHTKQVLSAVHAFDEVKPCLDTPGRDEALPMEHFAGRVSDMSMPCSSTIGFGETPQWYHPGPGRHSVAFCDLQVLRQCVPGRLSELDCTWLGCIVRMEHRLLLREVLEDGSRGQWCFWLVHVLDCIGRVACLGAAGPRERSQVLRPGGAHRRPTRAV